MKAISTSLLVLLIAVSLAARATAHVVLDYPVGGETFSATNTVNIQWHTVIQHEQENWDLYFSSDDGQNWENIQLDLPVSQLDYDWIVPQMETDKARIKIVQDNFGGDYQGISGAFTIQQATTSVQATDENRPQSFTLQANYPNPFNATTTIRYALAEVSDVQLTIYNTLGQKVKMLVEEHQPAGTYHIQWDGRDQSGRATASGIYMYVLQADQLSEARKMVLMR